MHVLLWHSSSIPRSQPLQGITVTTLLQSELHQSCVPGSLALPACAITSEGCTIPRLNAMLWGRHTRWAG